MNYQSRPSKTWPLQEAKAKLSHVIKLAQSEGPQVVTVRGKYAVTISAVDTSQPQIEDLEGQELLTALRTGPLFDFDLPVADVLGPFED